MELAIAFSFFYNTEMVIQWSPVLRGLLFQLQSQPKLMVRIYSFYDTSGYGEVTLFFQKRVWGLSLKCFSCPPNMFYRIFLRGKKLHLNKSISKIHGVIGNRAAWTMGFRTR